MLKNKKFAKAKNPTDKRTCMVRVRGHFLDDKEVRRFLVFLT